MHDFRKLDGAWAWAGEQASMEGRKTDGFRGRRGEARRGEEKPYQQVVRLGDADYREDRQVRQVLAD